MAFCVFVFVVFVWLTGTVEAVDGDIDCGTARACHPWGNTDTENKEQVPCVRGKRMNLRLMLDVAAERADVAAGKAATAVYGFCPVVDQLDVFTLALAPSVATLSATGGLYSLTHNVGQKYLSAYGFGMSNSTLFPQKGHSTGAVVVVGDGMSLCGSPHSVALVHTLLLDIGFHRGRFNYIGARKASPPPNATYSGTSNATRGSHKADNEETEVAVQPAMVGFRPTCDENDECLFDSASICVGDKIGHKNCAKCYDSPSDIMKENLVVWTSYYGTDAHGRPMRSGGLNPLNYRQFAGIRLFRDLEKALKRLKSGSLGW
ncbi:hypothetical protein TraAM80_08456 [Trypanosoma rangeli]|uniref:Uncharacterized protein n=1 Tax=Trypanosoma rangeli TaxID=5698 RepID=A0A3R7LKG2_TRYRA|nr:uncharacterized protein TraAM80_08456 [Trypanosoma rangeli]RNE99015.1 hypothetical protein TraAM80_08456 [Trypanosoma rangeli]|eukprot:RNE99015.1 hypothetical protein TraAM80_08456 [Trypanosoma rangeli]